MDENLDVTVAQAVFTTKVLERALHDNGPWTLAWGPFEVPVERVIEGFGVTFKADFPSNMGVHIPLTQDLDALVDEGDYARVIQHSWSASRVGDLTYAQAKIEGRFVRLHTFLMGEVGIDHVNGDGLDNRRSNLRMATKSQNGANRGATAANTSGYKGVSWHKASQKWKAQIGVGGKTIYLGVFDHAIEAAKAYDEAAKEHFGEFAALNLPTMEPPYPVAILRCDNESVAAKTIEFPGDGAFTVEWTLRARVVEVPTP